MSQDEVAATGGPSATTLSKIETGEAQSLRTRTATDLDQALGWEVGSTMALLNDGREPVLDPEAKLSERKVSPRFVRVERVDGELAFILKDVRSLPGGGQSRVELTYWPGERPGRKWGVDLETLNDVVRRTHDEIVATTADVDASASAQEKASAVARLRTKVTSGPADASIPMPEEPERPTPQPDSADDLAGR